MAHLSSLLCLLCTLSSLLASLLLLISLLGSLLTLLPILLTPQYSSTASKYASYECGYSSSSSLDASLLLDTYLVALLFLLLDLELASILPPLLCTPYLTPLGSLYTLLFFSLLSVGLLYELLISSW